jgi:hypothetical protein
MVNRVNIHLIHLLEDEIELTPVAIGGSETAVVLGNLLYRKDKQGSENHAEYGYPYGWNTFL